MTGITQNIWARPETIKNIVISMDICVKNIGTIVRCNTPAISVDAAAAYNNVLAVKGRNLDYYFFYLFLINYKREYLGLVYRITETNNKSAAELLFE
jgi:hypothetical protein